LRHDAAKEYGAATVYCVVCVVYPDALMVRGSDAPIVMLGKTTSPAVFVVLVEVPSVTVAPSIGARVCESSTPIVTFVVVGGGVIMACT
jgi:hypothetical protein